MKIKNYVILPLSDQPNKNGHIYPTTLTVKFPKELPLYKNSQDNEEIGKAYDIKRVEDNIVGTLKFDEKQVNLLNKSYVAPGMSAKHIKIENELKIVEDLRINYLFFTSLPAISKLCKIFNKTKVK